jgi:molybdopterin-guanine dinucleotide biosynthesis protein A
VKESTPSQPAVAIMAGGQSRRMGRDKAELELGGQTLLERAIDAAHTVSDTVLVIGRTGSRDDVRWLEDDEPGLGPIGGLKTALGHLGRPAVLVACDMPLLDAEAMRWLIDEFERDAGEHGLAATRDGQLEPLFSVYTPAVLPLVDAQIEKGRRSLRRLIEAGEFGRVEAPADVASKLVNVNTPEEFDRLDS